MANSEPLALYVDEEEESYLEWRKHAIEMHLALGIHKLLDLTAYIYINYCSEGTDYPAYPVSRITLN